MLPSIALSQESNDPESILGRLTDTENLFRFDRKSFVRGWNWGSDGRKLDSALRVNTNHMNLDDDFASKSIYRFSSEADWIFGVKSIANGDRLDAITQAQAIQFEPEFANYNPESDLYKRDFNSNVGSAFGFLSRNLSSADAQKLSNVLCLNKNNYPSERLILSNPWPDNELFYMPEFLADSKYDDKNGKVWYLSIKLKPLDAINSSADKNEAILKIKIPYTAKRKKNSAIDSLKGYIKFDKLPDASANSSAIETITDSYNRNRGLSRRMITDTSKYEITITRGMLMRAYPADTKADTSFITISARFITDGSDEKKPNHYYLQSEEHKIINNEIWRISNLGIEVKYCGKESIGIDWIRFETPQYRKLVRGELDKSIRDNLQSSIDKFRTSRGDLKIHRFLAIDEFWPSNWLSQRYYNKLVSGNLSGEIEQANIDVAKFYAVTGFKEYWGGNKSVEMSVNCSLPYLRRGDHYINGKDTLFNKYDSYGFQSGRRGWLHWNHARPNDTFSRDTLNSCYEFSVLRTPCFDYDNPRLYQALKTEDFWDLPWDDTKPVSYIQSTSPLVDIESRLYKEYYQQPAMLYNDRPWIANIWPQVEIEVIDDNQKDNLQFRRAPMTGEYLRYNYWNNIILGCKGFETYIGSTAYEVSSAGNNKLKGAGSIGLSGAYARNSKEFQDSLPTGDNLVYSRILGADYNSNSDILKINTPHSGSNFKSLSSLITGSQEALDSLGMNRDSIYLGTRSKRLEMMKVYKYIERLEQNKINNPSQYPEDLTDLRLLCWQGSGFHKTFSYDSKSNYNTVANYIVRDQIKTAKLWIPERMSDYIENATLTSNYVRKYENIDSSFYDVSILRRKEDSPVSANNIFYIGVQNRRTDPLIYDIENVDAAFMKFYSTAEFDDGCASSDQETSRYFRDYFWKRLGSRMIEIPLAGRFNIHNSGTSWAVRVKEPLATDQTFNNDINNKRWRDPEYSKNPNVIYVSGGTSDPVQMPKIKVQLLPGEGKLIRVEAYQISRSSIAMSSCPTEKELLLNMAFSKIEDGKISYDLTLENNTKSDFENLPIIIEDDSKEAIDYISAKDVDFADLGETDGLHDNKKVLIPAKVPAMSKVELGAIRISKENPMKMTYAPILNTNEKNICNSKHCPFINNSYRKESELEFNNRINGLHVKPNPANDKAEIEFSVNEAAIANIVVTDAMGNELITIKDYNTSKGINTTCLNLQKLSSGIYNVIVKTNAQTITSKFAVVK
jgi:hypothetical protein